MRRLVVVAALFAVACSAPEFTEPQVLGGETVAAETLELGREVYVEQCAVCHGLEGDGRGPAAWGMWPPPRDFTTAKFKFAGIQDRGLPADAELARIIEGGLAGTPMRAWDLADAELAAVIDYLKTFSPPEKGFRSERLEVKAPEIPPDPYQDEAARQDAIARGEKLYHSIFQCASCHPAYVPLERFADWDARPRAEDPYAPVPKWAPEYRVSLVPPDFLRHPMRAVRTEAEGGRLSHRADDLYRAIAYGLQGPMPGYGHLGAADVWAVAHYVKSLADLRGTAEAWALRRRLTGHTAE